MKNTLNICKQRSTLCQGPHVDPEFTLNNEIWQLTDRTGLGPVVETVNRLDGERAHAFYARVSKRASEIDRELACSRCYR